MKWDKAVTKSPKDVFRLLRQKNYICINCVHYNKQSRIYNPWYGIWQTEACCTATAPYHGTMPHFHCSCGKFKLEK